MALFSKKPRPRNRPNVLVLMGDDIGVHNLSCYSHGITGWFTENIDRIAKEGALFTDCYAQQSCTAGRAAFMLGQTPFRLGLLTIGLPGDSQGIPEWAPTMADLVKDMGYKTGQFGKNHFGDQNSHLPTVHGFDEFYGNLYHLNAQEEPETDMYPTDAAFVAQYGPRGVMDCKAMDNDSREKDDPRFGPVGKQVIKDTGPLTRARMPDFDDGEIEPRAVKFIEEAVRTKDNFFVWVCGTRCHIHTRLKAKSQGVTGMGIYADGLKEHDEQCGRFLKLLDDLKIADDTIVIYCTDNGAETLSWPDGGVTPFHGEKGTTWEGGFRCPFLMRWPGVIDPGVKMNDLFALEDVFPTILHACGMPDVVNKLKAGIKTGRRSEWKVHLDGFDFLPYFLGDVDRGPRNSFIYWSQKGEMNAVRFQDWKVTFASINGNMANGVRAVPAFPRFCHLRSDPYETAVHESELYMRWYMDQMWLFVPIGQVIANFAATLDQGYPFQAGATHGPAEMNYTTLAALDLARNLSPATRLAAQTLIKEMSDPRRLLLAPSD